MKEKLRKFKKIAPQYIKRAAIAVVRFFKKLRALSKREARFYLTGRAKFYILLILFALVFTQALRSPVSSVIFTFLLLLPITSLLILLLETLTIRVHLDNTASEVQKMQPVDFSLTVANESPIPYPFVEARIVVPTDDAIRCESVLTRLSLTPFGKYRIEKHLKFSYRGAYQIGVSDIYVYDYFRLFRYRIDMNLFAEIFVMPRKLSLTRSPDSDLLSENTETTTRAIGTDNTEMNDIRAYEQGDSLRQIHWKLSSKVDDLIVRQYAHNSEKQSIIFCDNAKRYSKDEPFSDDVNECVVDTLIETTIALATDILSRNGATLTIAWFDNRAEDGICRMHFDSRYEFEEAYRVIATAPIADTKLTVSSLIDKAAKGVQNSNYYFITGKLDGTFASAISDMARSSLNSAEVLTALPVHKADKTKLESFFESVEAARAEIIQKGIRIYNCSEVVTIPTVKVKEEASDE